MNEEIAAIDETRFDVLEEKVNRVVELIQRLRAERRKLLEVQADLEARLAEAGAAPPGMVEGLSARIAELEKERAGWMGEKRDLTRRMEGILAKLELLESESVTH